MIFVSAGNAFSETITLATLNWQPFFGDDLPEEGFYTALSREAFKRAGYELKVMFVPWKRALVNAKKGYYDGLLGAYYADERTQYFYYTDSISTSDEVFLQRKGYGITYKKIEDLKKYTIGGLRSGAQVDDLIKLGFNVEVATDEITNIKKLHAKRFELILLGKQQLYHYLNNIETLKPLKGKFEVLEPPFKTYKLFNTITKKRVDGEDIVRKFNIAIKNMRTDGSFYEILKRFGQK